MSLFPVIQFFLAVIPYKHIFQNGLFLIVYVSLGGVTVRVSVSDWAGRFVPRWLVLIEMQYWLVTVPHVFEELAASGVLWFTKVCSIIFMSLLCSKASSSFKLCLIVSLLWMLYRKPSSFIWCICVNLVLVLLHPRLQRKVHCEHLFGILNWFIGLM